MFNPRFLRSETWGFPSAPVEHIETHAAHVFLVGNRAFKLKKPVKLPYLDFSSVEKRKDVLARELVINRVHAPGIYLNVIETEGEPVLVMERFDTAAILSHAIPRGGIGDGLADALADTVAGAHGLAPRAVAEGAAIMAGLGAQLSRAFVSSRDLFPAAETLEFHALYGDALTRLMPLLNRRGKQGLVRRCHGDMHCGNIVVIEGKPLLFDAIEFSEAIATIDVLYDLAFLLMDLLRHGERRAANRVLNRYLHWRRDAEDLSGLAALPLFLATRAGVRALVTADLVHELPVELSLKHRGEAMDYFRANLAYLKPRGPELICVGGLSGTGKSTVAASLAPSIGAAPGALHIRSDVERKVLAGVPETGHLAAGHYSGATSMHVYEAVFNRAERALAAGHSVILDAVFASENERRVAETLAKRGAAAFRGVWLEAGIAALKARVSNRVGDASDATPDVIDLQSCYDLGQMNWTRIDASGTADETSRAVRRMLPPRPAGPA